MRMDNKNKRWKIKTSFEVRNNIKSWLITDQMTDVHAQREMPIDFKSGHKNLEILSVRLSQYDPSFSFSWEEEDVLDVPLFDIFAAFFGWWRFFIQVRQGRIDVEWAGLHRSAGHSGQAASTDANSAETANATSWRARCIEQGRVGIAVTWRFAKVFALVDLVGGVAAVFQFQH